jgi:hypothetical protein
METIKWDRTVRDATSNANVDDKNQEKAYDTHCVGRRVHLTLTVVERHLAHQFY